MLDKYIIYIDLDGVLTNLDKKIFEITGKYLPESDRFPKHEDRLFWKDIREYSKHHEFWRSLEMFPQAKALWEFIKPYRPIVLTALPYGCPESARDKKDWVRENLGEEVKTLVVTEGVTKGRLYASPNSILIDDCLLNINGWGDKGGIGIHHNSVLETIERLESFKGEM